MPQSENLASDSVLAKAGIPSINGILQPHLRFNMKIQISDDDQIGLIRKKCADQGITNIKEVAQTYEAVRQLQVQNGTWCYENFTESGSSSSTVIKSFATNANKQCIIWSINHYLGLNRHPSIINASIQALHNFGSGCGTSAVSGGHSLLHKQLEIRLARAMQKSSAILFPTGYSANVGAISGIAKIGNSVVICDRECHASIIDGIKLSGAKLIPFRHNNVDDLNRKLLAVKGKFDNIIVVVESVYSMSGEEASLTDIVELKNSHEFYLFVDEAHAFGLYSVGGLSVQLGLTDKIDFLMTTLSKSTASIGGVIATSRDFVTLLMAEANAYLFQAALTPPDAAAIIASLDLIESDVSIVRNVWEKTNYFRQNLKNLGFDVGIGSSPIVPLYVRNSEILFSMGREMQENGVFTTSIAYPAVKHSEVRFRFILNNSHTYDQINYTIDILGRLGKKYGLSSQ